MFGLLNQESSRLAALGCASQAIQLHARFAQHASAGLAGSARVHGLRDSNTDLMDIADALELLEKMVDTADERTEEACNAGIAMEIACSTSGEPR